ncbi:hypothetical protein HMPREF1326_01330, partial [Akkermansia sp. KLE1605]
RIRNSECVFFIQKYIKNYILIDYKNVQEKVKAIFLQERSGRIALKYSISNFFH